MTVNLKPLVYVFCGHDPLLCFGVEVRIDVPVRCVRAQTSKDYILIYTACIDTNCADVCMSSIIRGNYKINLVKYKDYVSNF